MASENVRKVAVSNVADSLWYPLVCGIESNGGARNYAGIGKANA